MPGAPPDSPNPVPLKGGLYATPWFWEADEECCQIKPDEFYGDVPADRGPGPYYAYADLRGPHPHDVASPQAALASGLVYAPPGAEGSSQTLRYRAGALSLRLQHSQRDPLAKWCRYMDRYTTSTP